MSDALNSRFFKLIFMLSLGCYASTSLAEFFPHPALCRSAFQSRESRVAKELIKNLGDHVFSPREPTEFTHQIKINYFNKLGLTKGSFQALPRGWVEAGPMFLWMMLGRRNGYYSEGQDRRVTLTIQTRPNWKFVRADELVISEDFVDTHDAQIPSYLPPGRLWQSWLLNNPNPGGNEFSPLLRKRLEQHGFPSHSQFYFDHRINGVWIEKESRRGRIEKEWILLHDLAASVRLESSPNPAR